MTDSTSTQRRPISLIRWLGLLCLGCLALFAYIGLQRDIRLKRYTIEQGAWYAATLHEKVGESSLLPLNLTPVIPVDRTNMMIRMDWLSRDDARLLRQTSERIMIGHSIDPLRRVLAPDGWLVIFFQSGRFSGEWLSEPDYDLEKTHMHELLKKLRSDPALSAP